MFVCATPHAHCRYHTPNGCQWDIQAPLGAPSGPPYPNSVAPATSFNPEELDTDQWMEAAGELGASQVCLTVRHVDGFSLWPTAANNYSVASSPWRGGKGDVVKDFVTSARKYNISPCFYIILGFNVYANQVWGLCLCFFWLFFHFVPCRVDHDC